MTFLSFDPAIGEERAETVILNTDHILSVAFDAVDEDLGRGTVFRLVGVDDQPLFFQAGSSEERRLIEAMGFRIVCPIGTDQRRLRRVPSEESQDDRKAKRGSADRCCCGSECQKAAGHVS